MSPCHALSGVRMFAAAAGGAAATLVTVVASDNRVDFTSQGLTRAAIILLIVTATWLVVELLMRMREEQQTMYRQLVAMQTDAEALAARVIFALRAERRDVSYPAAGAGDAGDAGVDVLQLSNYRR